MGFGIGSTPEAEEKAADFLWRHARLLERRRFLRSRGDGSADSVLDAVLAYQNADGGFGQALEPDKRTPHSQPVDVEFALRVMDEVGVLPRAPVHRACDWLQAVATEEGGVPFSLPTANAYPHAPWWHAAERPPASLNPSAAIAGILLRHEVQHPWLERAIRYCTAAIEAWSGADFHTASCVVTFLQHAPERAWARDQLDRLKERIGPHVERDPTAEGYVQMPLDWAPTPDHPLRKLFDDELLVRHLEALRDRQREDGGWPISWEPVSLSVAAEWRGIRTLQALATLHAYA